MTPLIILAAIAGLPVLLAILFRVNAVYLFVSLAAGYLMLQFLGDDAGLAMGAFIRGANVPMASQFLLLFAPLVFTLLVLRKSLPASKLLFHIIPLIAIGVAAAALALPLLPSPAQQQIFSKPYGDVFRDAQDVAVGAAAVLILLLMWLTMRHKEGKKGKHK